MIYRWLRTTHVRLQLLNISQWFELTELELLWNIQKVNDWCSSHLLHHDEYSHYIVTLAWTNIHFQKWTIDHNCENCFRNNYGYQPSFIQHHVVWVMKFCLESNIRVLLSSGQVSSKYSQQIPIRSHMRVIYEVIYVSLKSDIYYNFLTIICI